jgi:CheY-like chemotaxis protein
MGRMHQAKLNPPTNNGDRRTSCTIRKVKRSWHTTSQLYTIQGFGSAIRIVRPSGDTRWCVAGGAATCDSSGRPVRLSGVTQDITAIRLAELQMEAAKEAAEEANRAKSQFLANMSHELRTPLTAVIGYSEMLQEELEDLGQESLLSDMRKIEANARHLLGLINDVLDISKIEAERMEVYPEDFDVAEAVRDVAATVEALVAKRGNTLIVEAGGDLGSAHLDVTKLRQCLINLLSNAAKFTERGRITFSASRQESDGIGWLTFRVADTGIGMSAAHRPGMILLDLMMPEMDGFGFLRALRARPEWLDIPVVVLTAKDITADERRRLGAQADRLLQKGQLSVPDLVATLRLLMLPPTLVAPSSAADVALGISSP